MFKTENVTEELYFALFLSLKEFRLRINENYAFRIRLKCNNLYVIYHNFNLFFLNPFI